MALVNRYRSKFWTALNDTIHKITGTFSVNKSLYDPTTLVVKVFND
jgi:hypothetical protein